MLKRVPTGADRPLHGIAADDIGLLSDTGSGEYVRAGRIKTVSAFNRLRHASGAT
jgi:hypothetical protein